MQALRMQLAARQQAEQAALRPSRGPPPGFYQPGKSQLERRVCACLLAGVDGREGRLCGASRQGVSESAAHGLNVAV